MSPAPYRVLLASADLAVSTHAAALVAEDDELEIAAVVTGTGDVAAAAESHGVDAVMVHESVGPLPVMDLVRDVGARLPQVGVVLVVAEGGSELLRAALQAGARDVLELPLSLEEIEVGVKGAARWSRAVRRSAAEEEEAAHAEVGGGRVVALAGAKGGVGTTTVALQLALTAVRLGRDRSVCLVDLDLQAGDVGVMIDVSHRRSVLDLTDVSGEISAAALETSTYLHSSGLRVLLAPAEGERGEEVSAAAARRVVGALKSTYDVVVIDCGTIVTEAGAAAVDAADEVLVVATPDVPAVRGANRLGALWRRLGLTTDGTRLLVNRTSRGNDVQPDLMRKVVELPIAPPTIPASFRDLEVAINTGAPELVAERSLGDAYAALARDLGLAGSAGLRQRLSLRAEAGQVAVEAAGMAGLVMVIALLLWQAVLAGYTFVLAGHSAREGARQFAVGKPAEAAARQDLPGAWREGMRVSEGDNYVEVSLSVPALVPGLDTPARVSTRAGTVVEDDSAASEDAPADGDTP